MRETERERRKREGEREEQRKEENLNPKCPKGESIKSSMV